jgi:hypothetical protein
MGRVKHVVRGGRRGRGDERGSALPLLVLGVVLGGLIVLLAARLGGAAVDRAAARSAADAAALAGAAEDEGAARQLAADNGATVVGYEKQGSDARVEVDLGDARAVGRARRSGGGAAGPPGAAPALRAALGRAGELLGREIPTVRVHLPGLGVDVSPLVVDRLLEAGPEAGLCHPWADVPTYFEVCPAPSTSHATAAGGP